jgi:DNA-binding NarL/FixJ family response regulator
MSIEVVEERGRPVERREPRPPDPTRDAAVHGATSHLVEVVVLGSRHGVRDLIVAGLARGTSPVGSFGPDRTDGAIAEAARRAAVLVVDGGSRIERDTLLEAVVAARHHDVDVVVALCRRDPVTAARWVEAGANAVVTEDAPVVELLDLIERVRAGQQVIGVSIREGLLTHLRTHRQVQQERAAAFSSLTRRESQVLRDLALGMTPEEVARSSYVSLNTVRSQIRGVLAKLAVNSVVAAVAIAYRSGWMHEQTGTER